MSFNEPFQISLTSTEPVIERVYHDGISLSCKYYVGVKAFVTYNSIANISKKYKQAYTLDFVLKSVVEGKPCPKEIQVEIPTGTYEMKELCEIIIDKSKAQGVKIEIALDPKATQKLVMKSDHLINFTTPNTIAELLGFKKRIYNKDVEHVSNQVPKLFTINTIKIKCSLVNSNINNNNLRDNTLYEFPLTGSPGEKIVERPNPISYYKTNTDEIHTMDVNNYVEVSQALAERFDNLKRGKYLKNQLMSERYAPITTPLRTLSSNINNYVSQTPTISTIPKQFSSTPIKNAEHYNFSDAEDEHWVDDDDAATVIDLSLVEQPSTSILHSPRQSKKYLKDSRYGLRVVKNEYKIGNKRVKISDDNKLIFDKHTKYDLTPGLVNLLTQADLVPEDYTPDDFANYGEIVKDSFCYKYRNQPDTKRLKGIRTKKFTSIIAPILTEVDNSQVHSTPKKGGGLRKLLTNTPVEYIYWNTLDELLERLYILYGEIKAGNKNPNLVNEIVNIIQEFREL
ncbi:hypothetical protein V9T40_007041 [Parthenolecanium corni]|uniref:DUF8207 domain-containing protein n=1 Tax=Parthenolecanium corni TaxID=536013 RepID=A0AAN9U4J9_9HEMI